ncbi:hypothetical protein RHMOL_Rhmol11G0079500 [Rhododendron molle]|uniref:Uncharacterized protein n=1 Tax=Rhododendron molle TaxID=49168 RepID=A0ACC0LQR4_RHOML|nr:hypothetical protein RHMOL_Rhmol11G0079500 [Rhododendron molle]
MGGLGKTTLAQLAFNDVRLKSHFEPKIWVYVSQDFNVKRVIKATIESSGKAIEASDLDSLQRQLRDILNGKRYLLVLDDVWSDNQDKWDTLKCVLGCGSKGASIIITTRLGKVSSIMGTIPPFYFSFLSEDDCWLLFRQRAFGHGDQERQDLVDIGKEIVKKCGVCLYLQRPLEGYCASKDVEKHPDGNTLFKMHDLMHDLAQFVMEDECHVLENESSSCIPKQRIHHITLLGYAMKTIVFPKSVQSVKSLRSILLQYREPYVTSHPRDASYRFYCDFSKLRLLRAFDARGAKMVQLSSSIGNLKHLSDWESQANVEQLLEALGPHQNIEELKIRDYKGMDYVEYIDNDFPGGGPVRGFPSLEQLSIYDLPNLNGLSREQGRDLLPRLGEIIISNCPKLTLPRLSSSETLTVDIFVCSNSNVMLSSISNLNRLTSLTVYGNDDAISLPEEMLQNLTSLESLEIWRFSKLKVLPTNLSGLVSLKSLRIVECHELESFLEHGLRSLKSLQRLEINHCNSLSSLSESLGHLTALEVLDVSCCPKLVAIPESIRHLGSLRDLTLSGRPSSWLVGEVLIAAELKTLPEALQHVTSLQSLSISYYPELTSLPEWLGNFSSLQSLYIFDCPKIQSLPQSIQSLTKLKTLTIRGCGRELARRCKKEDGEDRYKIAHIQELDVYPLLPTPSETASTSTKLLVASHVVLLRCRHAALTETRTLPPIMAVSEELPVKNFLGNSMLLFIKLLAKLLNNELMQLLNNELLVYSTCIINSNTRVSIYRSDSKVCAEMNGFKGLDTIPFEEPFTGLLLFSKYRPGQQAMKQNKAEQNNENNGTAALCRSVRSRSPLQGVTVGSEGVGNKGDACFLYVKQGVIVEDQLFACFVTDGAWDKVTGRGAAAWVQEGGADAGLFQTAVCQASSAALVEIKAGLLLLEWANHNRIPNICIKTDSLVFVQGLWKPDKACLSLTMALHDFLLFCSCFNVVKVVKVSRLLVKAAHDRAREALK